MTSTQADTVTPPGANHFPVHIPFLKWMGLQYLAAEPGKSSICLSMNREHTNSFSVAHGGVQMTMLDVAMAMAARTLFNDADLARADQQYGMVTIEMKTTFMDAAIYNEGVPSDLFAHGVCLKRTSQFAFCEAEIVDSSGKMLAKASGTFKAIKQRTIQR